MKWCFITTEVTARCCRTAGCRSILLGMILIATIVFIFSTSSFIKAQIMGSTHIVVPNSAFIPYNKQVMALNTSTQLDNWSFSTKIDCPEFNVKTSKTKWRKIITIDCDQEIPRLVLQWTDSPDDIFRIPFGDPCLISVIENTCMDDKPVPNVMHYVWYSERELDFFPFLSMMSALRFMKPCLILLHGNYIPYGKYWNYFVSLFPYIINVKRDRPTHVFGHKLAYMEHAGDVMRIEAIQVYGGTYIDFDTILLRSPEPLRKFDVTMGKETSDHISCAFIMAKRNATFLNIWYLNYRDDYQSGWVYNSGYVPFKIYQKHPDLIHVDGYNFTRPNWNELKLIFELNYNWSTNYAMHMFIRVYKKATDPSVIRTLNTTIGSVARHVLLGNKELCKT